MIEEANGLSLKDEMNLIPGKAELWNGVSNYVLLLKGNLASVQALHLKIRKLENWCQEGLVKCGWTS
jgi:hypothetical protein